MEGRNDRLHQTQERGGREAEKQQEQGGKAARRQGEGALRQDNPAEPSAEHQRQSREMGKLKQGGTGPGAPANLAFPVAGWRDRTTMGQASWGATEREQDRAARGHTYVRCVCCKDRCRSLCLFGTSGYGFSLPKGPDLEGGRCHPLFLDMSVDQ